LDQAALHIVEVGLAKASEGPLGWGVASAAHTTCTMSYALKEDSIFINNTLLGTVIRLFIPASVNLYTDKPVGDLLWTNPWMV
jgi:hypothetical protein